MSANVRIAVPECRPASIRYEESICWRSGRTANTAIETYRQRLQTPGSAPTNARSARSASIRSCMTSAPTAAADSSDESFVAHYRFEGGALAAVADSVGTFDGQLINDGATSTESTSGCGQG